MTILNKAMPGVAPEDVTAVILQRFDAASRMFARGQGADDLVASVYWPEVLAVAEGVPNILRGMDDLLPFAREFVPQLGRDVTFSVDDPILASGDLASCLAQVRCRHQDRPDEVHRVLYIWQRRGDEWRVVQEMLCAGPID